MWEARRVPAYFAKNPTRHRINIRSVEFPAVGLIVGLKSGRLLRAYGSQAISGVTCAAPCNRPSCGAAVRALEQIQFGDDASGPGTEVPRACRTSWPGLLNASRCLQSSERP